MNIIAILILIFCIIMEIIPNVSIDITFKLILYIFLVFLAFLNLKLKNIKIQDKDEKEKNRRNFLIIALIIYVILLITLVLIGNYRMSAFSGITLFSKEHFEIYSNFIPFSTIYDYIIKLIEERVNNSIFITNIIGNIFAFAPFGFFIPLIFKEKLGSLGKFTILMIGIVFIVECIQFITMTGAFDVDDIILNVLGAVIVFEIMKLKTIRKIIEKILE